MTNGARAARAKSAMAQVVFFPAADRAGFGCNGAAIRIGILVLRWYMEAKTAVCADRKSRADCRSLGSCNASARRDG
jgi:hypothetical protein